MQRILEVLQQILHEMRVANARNNGARVMYFLNAQPPFAQVQAPDGFTYKILPDGRAALLIGTIEGPIPQNPYPEVLGKLTFAAWVLNNRRWFPLAALALLALVALNFLLSATQAGYASQVIPTFAAVATCLLFVTGGAAVLGFVVWNFGRGISIPLPDKFGGQLSAGTPDVSPDILVMSADISETSEQFARRVHRAISEQGQVENVLVFAYKSDFGVIIYPPNIEGEQVQERFRRDYLTLDLSDWKQEVCEPRRFDRETWSEFVAYVNCFCDQYRSWAAWEKSAHNPLGAILNGAKVAATCLLLFFASFAGAQSAQPIPDKFKSTEQIEQAAKSVFVDSMQAERLKQEWLANRAAIAKQTEPVRNVTHWAFRQFFLPVFLAICVLLHLVAKSAFGESEHDPQGNVISGFGIAIWGHWARRILFVILILIAVVECLAGMLEDILTAKNLWVWFVWWFIKAWLFYKIIRWFTPDPKVIRPLNLPAQQGPQYQRLNG